METTTGIPQEQTNDEALHLSLMSGDKAAWSTVYQHHFDSVRRVCQTVIRDRDLAEDVAHDVFLEFLDRPDRLDTSRATISGYLRMMARRRAIDSTRSIARSRSREAASLPADHRIPHEPDPGRNMDAAHRQASVKAAVNRLPQPQRQVIDLAFYRDRTYRQLASDLSIPEGTAKSRVRLALRRLSRDRQLSHAM